MPATCWKSIHGLMVRATKVDACGIPVVGPCSVVTTDGLITASYSPEIAEGDEIEVKNAAGRICISSKDCPQLKWVNFEITLCGVDPDLFSLLSGYQTVLDWEGKSVGNRIGEDILCAGGVGLEIWSEVPGETCGASGLPSYGYFLIPWLKNMIIGDFEIQNGETTFTLTGRSEKGSGWGVGPHDVDPTSAANPPVPGPLLTPIGPKDHLDLHLTTVPPPAAVCGCQPLAA